MSDTKFTFFMKHRKMLAMISILLLIQVSLAKNMKKIVFKRSENYDLTENLDSYFDGNGKVNENNNDIVIRMRLNQNYRIECPMLYEKDLSFKFILFNNSIYDASKYYYRDKDDQKPETIDSNYFLNIKSKSKFDSIFDETKIVSYENFFEINRANVKHSGRYYCVYSRFDEKDYYVFNRLHLVFEEKVILAKFNDTIKLAPMKYDITENEINIGDDHFEWFYDDKTHKLDRYLSLDDENNILVIQLTDLHLFDVMFRSQNTLNGAYMNYLIECLDCEKFSHAPIMTPLKQIATIGSDIIFTCDKPFHSVEPERFIWLKKETEFKSKNLNNPSSNGQMLKLKNVNLTDSGWYMCCIFYSFASSTTKSTSTSNYYDDYYYYQNEKTISNNLISKNFKSNKSPNMTCSTAHLIVNDNDFRNSNNQTINDDNINMRSNLKKHFSNIVILYLAIFLMLFFVVFFIFSFNFKLKHRWFIHNNYSNPNNNNNNSNNNKYDENNISNFSSSGNKNRYQFTFNKDAQSLNISTAKLTTQFEIEP